MSELSIRLKVFMEQVARSCSRDFGCVTPLYVYRMWGGQVPLKEIEAVFKFQDPRFMFVGIREFENAVQMLKDNEAAG